MLKHPHAGAELTAITIDVLKADADYLKQTLCNRGDKLCLVNLITNFTSELRSILTEHPEYFAGAARVGRELSRLRLIPIEVFAAIGLPTPRTAQEEPAHVQQHGGSSETRDGTTNPPNESTIPKSKSSKRRRQDQSQAPSEDGVQKATKSGRHSRGGA